MSRRTLPELILALLLIAQWSLFLAHGDVRAASAGAAVVMITDLQGKAAIDGQQKGSISITATLPAGTRVRLDSDSKLAVLYLESGDEFVFNGPALIAIRLGEPDVLKGSPGQKISRPYRIKGVRIDPSRVAQPAIVLRSFPAIQAIQAVKLVSPSGTVVFDTLPEFRWEPLHSDVLYSFELTDETGKKIYETHVRGTTVKLPAADMLRPGTAYTWDVSVRQPDGTTVSRREAFRVAAPELQAELTALRPAADAPLSERVAFAAWLDQAGFKDEARKYWRSASAERPADEVLRRLARE